MLKRDVLEELYDYTGFAWAMIAQAIAGMPTGDLTRAAPGSGWPDLRAALMHVTGSYDYWLHKELGLAPVIDPAPRTMTSWEAFEHYRESTRATFRRALDETVDAKLYELFSKVYDEEDDPETLSVADIMTNLLLHERGHHGDISTLFYQLGAKPPFLDYRMYVYLKANPASPLRPKGW